MGDRIADEIVDFRAGRGDRIVLDSRAFRGLDTARFRLKTTDGWSKDRGGLFARVTFEAGAPLGPSAFLAI